MPQSTKWPALRGQACCGRALAPRALVAVAVGVLATFTLQGCDIPHVEGYFLVNHFDASSHGTPEWRSTPSYWETNSYRDPETGAAAFNSCTNTKLSVVEVCGGHGHCAPIDPNDVEHLVLYCRCNPDHAGVECTFRRKKQTVAWFLSLLFGPLALDEIYLGWPEEAMAKMLVVIIGAAIGRTSDWGIAIVMFVWMFDVVRIGLGPVRTTQYRVEEDLPRLTMALLTLLHFSTISLLAGLASMYWTVLARRRRGDMMLCYGATKAVL